MFFLRNFKNIFKNFKYTLVKKGVTSNGSKYSFKFKRKLPIKLIFKKLFVKIKNSAGRTSSGRISVFSKGKRTFKKRLPCINYSFRLRFIGFVANIIVLPYTHRLISMFFLSTGGITYIPTAHNHTLFKLVRMYRSEKNLQQLFNKLVLFNKLYFIERGFFLIKHLPKNQRVSLLEPLPGVGVKYVRSPASKATITKFDRKLNTALVKLPSGVRKVFSQYSLGSVNSNPFLENKYWKCNRAGYYRNFGKKSIVRGVAMNPVDHPHGGRAKSVSYQRTPWGKTTKYK